MRVLGIDYGQARIGIALSDPTGLFAQPMGLVRRKTDEQAIQEIISMVHEHTVEQCVVGLPRNMNGSEGIRAEQCRAFASLLGEGLNIPIDLYDERLTTVAAERMLKSADVNRKDRKKVVDSIAASMMLQGYLDSLRTKRNHADLSGGQDI